MLWIFRSVEKLRESKGNRNCYCFPIQQDFTASFYPLLRYWLNTQPRRDGTCGSKESNLPPILHLVWGLGSILVWPTAVYSNMVDAVRALLIAPQLWQLQHTPPVRFLLKNTGHSFPEDLPSSLAGQGVKALGAVFNQIVTGLLVSRFPDSSFLGWANSEVCSVLSSRGPSGSLPQLQYQEASH